MIQTANTQQFHVFHPVPVQYVPVCFPDNHSGIRLLPMPVSYTHLDVYKRQIITLFQFWLEYFPIFSMKKFSITENRNFIFRKCNIWFSRKFRIVDVYKRQDVFMPYDCVLKPGEVARIPLGFGLIIPCLLYTSHATVKPIFLFCSLIKITSFLHLNIINHCL